MNHYSSKLISKIQKLRQTGKTYSEINTILKTNIAKSTLSNWCSNLNLSNEYKTKIAKINHQNLKKAREIALKANQQKRDKYLKSIDANNIATSKLIKNIDVGMIAMAMLCLGEASKSKTKHKSFTLGSSDHRIITIFIKLLKRFPNFDASKIRCTVQCRADQNTVELEKYWQKITQVSPNLFYKARTDTRTIGKPTKNQDYKGVLVIDYYDKNIQLKLESLADLVYNQLQNEGPIA